MTIATELQHYNDGLLDAYDAVDAKGGTIPANLNLDNLPTAINSISGGGGGGTEPLDPVEVYNNTRPSDWLKMPEIGDSEDNVFYFLLMVPESMTEDLPVALKVSSTGTRKLEFGTTNAQGNFTADDTLTVTSSATEIYTSLAPSVFGNLTEQRQKQLICKLSSTAPITQIQRTSSNTAGYSTLEGRFFLRTIHEAKGKASGLTVLSLFGISNTDASADDALRYFNLLGANEISSWYYTFANCKSLLAIVNLNTSMATSLDHTFYNCRALVAIPPLDTSSCRTFTNTFDSCYSLTAIPQLDTSAGTNFNNMFARCSALKSTPQLDTSSGTNFGSMFTRAESLQSIPQLNTSSGTDFNSMFSYCFSLCTADFTGYDFSSATGSSALSSFLTNTQCLGIVELGDSFGANGLMNTSAFISPYSGGASAVMPLRIKINKTDAMLSIAANATTLFSTNQYVYVYVPDDLLATYQADTYWATLGTRLKGFSELPS